MATAELPHYQVTNAKAVFRWNCHFSYDFEKNVEGLASLESTAVGTGDLYSVQMGPGSLLALRQSNGRLPYAERPFSDMVSYTYHLHNLIGMSYGYRFDGDQRWLSNHGSQYVPGIQWAWSSVDSTGLAAHWYGRASSLPPTNCYGSMKGFIVTTKLPRYIPRMKVRGL